MAGIWVQLWMMLLVDSHIVLSAVSRSLLTLHVPQLRHMDPEDVNALMVPAISVSNRAESLPGH